MKTENIDRILEELIAQQQNKLLSFAREIRPTTTSDDLLQPNDYPELENHPYFRYLEGILQGMQGAQMAIRANFKSEIS